MNEILTPILIIVAVITLTAFAIHVVRFFKLKALKRKRDACDLTTEKGRSLKKRV